MLNTTARSFQNLLISPRPLTRRLTVGGILALGAAAIALFIGVLGPMIALALAVAIVGGTLVLVDTHWGFVALVAVVFGLPFASLPFSIGFKPTFLDVALGALFFVWLFKLITGQERKLIGSPLGLAVLLFMLMASFSFAYGLTHSRPTSFTVRRFAEILLGISLFFVIVNTVRTQEELDWVSRWLFLAGWACAAIAVAFYVIPEEWTVFVLDRLARFDYPGGFGALRWIGGDPAGDLSEFHGEPAPPESTDPQRRALCQRKARTSWSAERSMTRSSVPACFRTLAAPSRRKGTKLRTIF